jgi:hypothetical protein
MARKIPPGIFLFVSEWAVNALPPALLLAEPLLYHFSNDDFQSLTVLLFTPTSSVEFSTKPNGTLSHAFW